MKPPLVAHVIHHLIMGGLENGLINLVNHMPTDRYRHAIICMEGFSSFRERIIREDVGVFAIGRKPGRDPRAGWRLWKLMRRLKPAIVHSRNLSGLDALVPATLAGVTSRIHGEHGWYDEDPDGSNRKYQILRKLHRPFVSRYVALSSDLENYLHQSIGVGSDRISRIYNGVDIRKFSPGEGDRQLLPSRLRGYGIVVGTVGRFQKIKDPMNLARSFAKLLEDAPDLSGAITLVMLGEGPERDRVTNFLESANLAQHCWLPGAVDNVKDFLRVFDVFVQPSLGEGISNTILEAMASALPVVATDVGGNGELVADGATGTLVPSADSSALAAALELYARDPVRRRGHGQAARDRCRQQFSLEAMINNYIDLYDEQVRGDNR